jgi:hypothetical protein
MGIRADAGELLLFSYKEYLKKHVGELVNFQEFQKETGWEEVRINNALEYLRDKNLVDVNRCTSKGLKVFGGTDFKIMKVNPEGIDIIEDGQKFKNVFGFEIKLGLIKFSWTRTKNN